MVKAIVGANWGDEGKGKITDAMAKEADVVEHLKCEPAAPDILSCRAAAPRSPASLPP